MSDTASMIVPSVGEIVKLRKERDQWRECAEELGRIIDDLDARDEPTIMRINESVDRFNRLKEASK